MVWTILNGARRIAPVRLVKDKRATGSRSKTLGFTSVFAKIHLWIGLTAGAILAMCGLTGSYLAFYPEIETAAIAPLRVSPGARPDSLEAVYKALAEVGPPKQGAWSIEMPPGGGVITSRFAQKGQPNRMVSLDPVSLGVVRDVSWGSTVSTWLYELHYHLLLGRSGATIMGIVGIIALALLVTGIVLWWRSGRRMSSRFRFDPQGNTQRKLYDVHRLLGIGSIILLLASVATATTMSLPKQVRPILAAFSPIDPTPKFRSEPAAGRDRLPVDQAVAIAQRRFPKAELRWVQVPNKPDGTYAVRFWQQGEPGHRFPRTYVWVDQYDGHVLGFRSGLNASGSDMILAWLYPLHGGEAFGLVGRSIVALLGFVPTILLVTGVLRWRSKAARKAAHRRHLAKSDLIQAKL